MTAAVQDVRKRQQFKWQGQGPQGFAIVFPSFHARRRCMVCLSSSEYSIAAEREGLASAFKKTMLPYGRRSSQLCALLYSHDHHGYTTLTMAVNKKGSSLQAMAPMHNVGSQGTDLDGDFGFCTDLGSIPGAIAMNAIGPQEFRRSLLGIPPYVYLTIPRKTRDIGPIR